MAFNAYWEFERLAQQLGKTLPQLLIEFKLDLADMVNNCPAYRVEVSNSGNTFLLFEKGNIKYEPPDTSGLYAIFTSSAIVYFGEATNLRRRQLVDPDNTADSGKTFSNQGRAILKFLFHNQYQDCLNLTPLYMQLYCNMCKLPRQNQQTFESCYRVNEYSKSLEGAMGLFIHGYHQQMIARVQMDGV